MKIIHASLLALVLGSLTAVGLTELVNTQVERQIDISTHLVKIISQVDVLNKGSSPVKEYTVQFGDPDHDDALAYMVVNAVGDNQKKTELKLARIDGSGEFASYIFDLPTLASHKSVKLEIEAAFTHMLTPYPEVISQAEKQLVVYDDRLYFPTPYLTEKQTTRVKVASSSGIESYTKVKASVSDRTITYGPFTNIPPTENAPVKTEEELRIHAENSSPFLTVSNLERSIQVSHWTGSVQVVETIDIAHSGAKLDGVFSRFDYQRDPMGSTASVKNWRTKLPRGAAHISYRDEIGNISTSTVRSIGKDIAVDIRPRFPLFGGWKTQYNLGYTVPAEKVFFADEGKSGEYVLKVPLVGHIYDNMVVDQANIKIILPEFATNFRIELPYDAQRRADEKHFSYFDTVGRPVIVLSKQNLVDWHIQNVVVRYHFSPISMLHEPLIVMGSIFSLCLFVIMFARTRMSLDGK